VKTYCKPAEINIESLDFIKEQVHLCFTGKRSKRRFQNLLVSTGKITRAELREEIRNCTCNKSLTAIDAVAEQAHADILTRSVSFEPVRQFQLRENGKLRNICEESPWQQIFEYISDHEESNQKIFFDGQIYDAFSLLIGLIQKAEMEIVLVDGYVDVGTLNILSKKKENVAVTVYTQQRTKLSQTDVDNFNAQYPKLDVKYTRAFHDRFLILDKTKAYHVGASLKDAGKKCFGINLIEDAGIVRDILQRLELETEE